MLRSFRVGNHRSIRTEQELVMLPGSARNQSVLTVAGVFGANAAGKSNLIDALGFMRDAVRSSYAIWEPGTGIPRSAFRLDPDADQETSIFVVELQLGSVRYTYGFEVDDSRVHNEWLYSYPQRRRRVLFEREKDSISFGSTLPDNRSRADILEKMTRSNALFLSLAARADQHEMLPVYEWFQSQLQTPRSPTGIRRGRPERILERRLVALHDRSPADRTRLLSLVRAADVGVIDLDIEDDPTETALLESAIRSTVANGVVTDAQESEIRSATKEQSRRNARMVFLHGPRKVPLLLDEQSQGTRSWLDLGTLALGALRHGGVLVVDELDASLHPRLAAQLVMLFRNEETNPHTAQLIFTTHDATLLSTLHGERTLAREHIWFVEKSSDGATTLFPLTDFHPRKEENTERRYLGGSYGAVPMYADSEFRQLAESLTASRAEVS